MKIRGLAELHALGNCRYALKVISLTGWKNTPIFGNEISYTVQFQLTNNGIASEIVTNSADTEPSLNVKRAIISLFQVVCSSESNHLETDVFGTCPTTVSLTTSGRNTVKVNKIRNLNLCSDRYSGFLATSSIKPTPLLNGDYNSKHRIKDGILQTAQVNEFYYYIPFSTFDAAPVVEVSTRITLDGKPTKSDSPKQGNVKSTIVFRNLNVIPISNLYNIKTALRSTVQSYANGPNESNLNELIRLMRSTKKTDLLILYTQVKSGTVHKNTALARKVYLEALFRVGTADSVGIIVDLSSNELTGKEVKLAFLSFTLVPSMTKETLVSINVSIAFYMSCSIVINLFFL